MQLTSFFLTILFIFLIWSLITTPLHCHGITQVCDLLNGGHMIVTIVVAWLLFWSRMTAILTGHMTSVWWSCARYLVVTWQLRGGHMISSYEYRERMPMQKKKKKRKKSLKLSKKTPRVHSLHLISVCAFQKQLEHFVFFYQETPSTFWPLAFWSLTCFHFNKPCHYILIYCHI